MTYTSASPAEARKLDDRYTATDGEVLMTGVQAAVRVIVEQMRADRIRGMNTAAFVSGYPGSPLGGFDLAVEQLGEIGRSLAIEHRPGLNEDLAATSVYGSQAVPDLPGAKVSGVLGVWYGKSPGVDRSGDAFRHGNFQGAHRNGGLVAFCGDDPDGKSSTLPGMSERTLAALHMPVLFPGSPQEIVDFGRIAIHMSRSSGLWVSIKVVTNVADAVGSVHLDSHPEPFAPVEVQDGATAYVHRVVTNLAPPETLEMQRTIVGPRLEIARAVARSSGLNRITNHSPNATFGIIAAGNMYYELREALRLLGLDDDALAALGVRILKLGLIWPLEPEIVHRFAAGLADVFVIEEEDGFLEAAIRDVLYAAEERPAIAGKTSAMGEGSLPTAGAIDADKIAIALAPRLQRLGPVPGADALQLRRPAPLSIIPLGAARVPYFCSGCPHNRSTDVPDGALVGAGIGCHGMVASTGIPGKGVISGLTHMGGEGAQWIGQAPFLTDPHLFQNLGDGTFAHSGSLAIRAAVAANVHITFKLLYNGTIAMTGAQQIQGSHKVAELTHLLQYEGVRRIVVTTDDVKAYKSRRLAAIVEVRGRDQILAVQEELRAEPGVTVLIHDQACAADLRRMRKRGKVADRPMRVAVNQRVCEACGDCGQKSHCLSVKSDPTEFGDKTSIEQGSCNKDYSCLEGDCPSFVTVIAAPVSHPKAAEPPRDLPVPQPRATEATLRLVGIGGTGVVTMAQVLGMAAVLDGKRTLGLDQTGMAQKGGPVVSDVRITDSAEDRTNRATAGSVDGYLVFDTLVAVAPANLAAIDSARAAAVVSTSQVQTGRMIGETDAPRLSIEQALSAISAVTLPGSLVSFDARKLATDLFGDETMGNTLVLGAAWQHGLIPLSLASMLEAIRLNGVAVERNLVAFHWGRTVVARPDAIPAGRRPSRVSQPDEAQVSLLVRATGAPEGSELERLLHIRVADLIAYQSVRYAGRYTDLVQEVVTAETRAQSQPGRASEAVARYFYKLMAYKDEYEVARLHLDPTERARLAADFGPDAKLRYMLHPPLLRAMGLKRKIALGRWFDPAFRALRAMRHLRGTPLDVFGYAEVRRVERQLISEYEDAVRRAVGRLDIAYDDVLRLCELPDLVRGYEDVKLRNVATYRVQLDTCLTAIEQDTALSA